MCVMLYRLMEAQREVSKLGDVSFSKRIHDDSKHGWLSDDFWGAENERVKLKPLQKTWALWKKCEEERKVTLKRSLRKTKKSEHSFLKWWQTSENDRFRIIDNRIAWLHRDAGCYHVLTPCNSEFEFNFMGQTTCIFHLPFCHGFLLSILDFISCFCLLVCWQPCWILREINWTL